MKCKRKQSQITGEQLPEQSQIMRKKKQADSEKQSQHTEKENTLKQANRLK